MANRLHDNELRIDLDLVESLIAMQFPRYAGMPLLPLGASGSSNVLFRLGDDFLVRLPRQPGGSVSIDKESRWLPMIRDHLPVAVPEIVGVGDPAFGFGERWSIVGWLDGDLPSVCMQQDPPRTEPCTLARDLAEFILALRCVEIPEAAKGDSALRWYRGRSLAEFDRQTRRNIQQCRSIHDLDLDLDAALAVWESAMKATDAHRIAPDCWYHSDLVAENLLLKNHHLTAVLDFGGLAIGDPAIDLHGAWEVLDVPAREVFRKRLGVSDADWQRGRAWALAIALGAFAYYWTKMPSRMRDRLSMARSVLADAI